MDRQLLVMMEDGKWFENHLEFPDSVKNGEDAMNWIKANTEYNDNPVFVAFKYDNPKDKVSRVTYTLPEGEEVEIKEPDLPYYFDNNIIKEWIKFKIKGVQNIKIERNE